MGQYICEPEIRKYTLFSCSNLPSILDDPGVEVIFRINETKLF